MTSRRDFLGVLASGVAAAGTPLVGSASATATAVTGAAKPWAGRGLDVPGLELVMQLVVTCSAPERMGPTANSKDGLREDVWPIVGGRFVGRNISGVVIPGGGDFPMVRPDGVTIIDALYRLRTDDGVTIIIHNKGLEYAGNEGHTERYRLVPEFTAPVGKHDWLNRSVFLSTLVYPVPAAMALARSPAENDRLIEVYRVT